ncbi:MAG: helix-turn-helix transcriptional regulator [Candidatus Dormibacteria bacterium]
MTAGVAFADFERDAATIGDAVLGAIHDVESAVPQLVTLRVEPEELVSASGIAARIGRSREGVRLWIAGRRGPGGFPKPVARIDKRTRLWKWSEVSRWLAPVVGWSLSPDGEVLAGINAWLEMRRYAPTLDGSLSRPDLISLWKEELARLSA